MLTFNKLVRDKIPSIIEANGEKSEFTILDEKTFIRELKKKLQEEVNEYLASSTKEAATEELPDILEVIHSLAKTHQVTIDQVEQVRQKKYEKRGGFEGRCFLVSKE